MREREHRYRSRSRSRSASPDDRRRSKYDDERRSRSQSYESVSPVRPSSKSRRSLSPRRTPPRRESPDARNRNGRYPSPKDVSPQPRLEESPSPHKSDVDAHYMLGLALMQKQEYPEGAKELERVLDLCRGADPKGYMVEEIWQELAKAKYTQWEEASSQRAWELQGLKQACETALKEKHDALQMEGFMDEAGAHMKQLEALDRVFEKVADAYSASEMDFGSGTESSSSMLLLLDC